MRLNNKNCYYKTIYIQKTIIIKIREWRLLSFLLLVSVSVLLLLLLFHPMMTIVLVHAYYDATRKTTTSTRTISKILSIPSLLFVPSNKYFYRNNPIQQQQITQKLHLYNHKYNNNNNNIAFLTVQKLRNYYQSCYSYTTRSQRRRQQQQQCSNQKSIGQNINMYKRLFGSDQKAEHSTTTTTTNTIAKVSTNEYNNINSSNSSSSNNNWVQDRIDVLMKKYNNNSSSNTITVYDLMQYSLQIFDEETSKPISSFASKNEHSDNDSTIIDLEPIQSTINILSFVLQLPWDSGYKDLQQIINTNINNKDDGGISCSSIHSNTIVSTNHIIHFIHLLYRRIILYEPIQYIIGQWDFLNYIVKIQSPLLCPRPETEELVVLAINDIQQIQQKQQQEQQQQQLQSRKSIRVLDIGCGTGCIGISIADQITNSFVIGIDIEPIAIHVSMINAQAILGDEQLHNRYSTMLTSIQDFNISLLNLINNDSTDTEATATDVKNDNDDGNMLLFDYVISNPPYIIKNEIQTLSPIVLNHESINALSDNSSIDGMDIIRSIIQKLPIICNTNAICWLEVDPKQPRWIQQYLVEQQQQHQLLESSTCENNNHDTLKQTTTTVTTMKKYVKYISTHQDLFGKDRFVKLQLVVCSSNGE